MSCHIGSLLLDPGPLMEAVDRVLALIDRLRAKGFDIRHADLGGGLGVAYKPEEVTPSIEEFVKCLKQRVAGRDLHVVLEPGRSIVAAAGVLLTKTLYRKQTGEKEFVIVDAAMNDLIRPALYSAHHEILPVRQNNNRRIRADVVGPVCETGDFLARDREMPEVHARRCPGDFDRGRLRIRAVVHLQRPPPPSRSAGGRRPLARRARARILRRPDPRRNDLTAHSHKLDGRGRVGRRQSLNL